MSLSDLCGPYIQTQSLRDEVEKNVIEFCEAPWGLGMGAGEGKPGLAPVQKFILKCYYNIPLNSSDKAIIINDKFNEVERFRLTEIEYLKFLNDEGRINIKEVTGDPGYNRPNLILVIGRRGYKTSTISIIFTFIIGCSILSYIYLSRSPKH